jgi:hypothetical protein
MRARIEYELYRGDGSKKPENMQESPGISKILP